MVDKIKELGYAKTATQAKLKFKFLRLKYYKKKIQKEWKWCMQICVYGRNATTTSK